MMGYYLLGNAVVDTTVPHRWPNPVALGGPSQTVCWLWPGMWVVEVEDAAEGARVTDGAAVWGVGDPTHWVRDTWYVYCLEDADALTMLARWGHGPNIWVCACEECVCVCGESWHTHPPLRLAPGELQQGSCPRLHQQVVLGRLTREYRAKVAQRAGGHRSLGA
jgi:hypothetical protein